MTADTIRIYTLGTRGSDLALWQAREVKSRFPGACDIERITTSGDRIRDIPLQGGSQVGFFTKEIEEHLLKETIDVAVHSLKDLPTGINSRLAIAAILERAPLNDLLIVHPEFHDPSNLLPVKNGCVVGAGSLRRQALVRLYAPGAVPTLIRGNVPTRLRKCRELSYGAILLARAGVERLGLDLSGLLVFEMNEKIWLPAPGQGAVAVEVRKSDEEALFDFSVLDHEPTHKAVSLERKLLERFEGGCHTAFGALARPVGRGWEVVVGIDRGKDGWGQAVFSGAYSRCADHSPADIPLFAPVTVTRQEDLWRAYP